jgi:hypothetical protein
MSVTCGTAGLGSARLRRAGCGIPPQRTFPDALVVGRVFVLKKSPRTSGGVRRHARGVRSPETSLRVL